MIRAFFARFLPRPVATYRPPVATSVDVLIAHRAERTCNRNAAMVAKYVSVQTILASRGQ
jgi:hypothetical protein